MHPQIYQYLKQEPELLQFVRYNPVWYRYLSRDPAKIYELPEEAKRYYGKTFPQRVEKLRNQIEMIHVLAQFAEAMKD